MTSATVLLDNEAVQSLMDPRHPKHRRSVALLAAALEGSGSGTRKGRRAVPLVPTAVRVEAGWNRADPAAAVINAFSIVDIPLDAGAADRAATVVRELRISVADAHLAATAQLIDGSCVVITSDTADMARIAAALDIDLRAVRL